MLKRCFKCGIEKPTNQFSKNKGRSDGLSGQCKECHSIMRKEHYENNKKKIFQQVNIKKKECYDWLITLKNKPCTDCGNCFPHYVMDFDHLGNKEFSVSNGRQGGFSKKRILEEIKKCELVCSNCHRIRTYERFQKSKNNFV